jgi:hypothetical protein
VEMKGIAIQRWKKQKHVIWFYYGTTKRQLHMLIPL